MNTRMYTRTQAITIQYAHPSFTDCTLTVRGAASARVVRVSNCWGAPTKWLWVGGSARTLEEAAVLQHAADEVRA